MKLYLNGLKNPHTDIDVQMDSNTIYFRSPYSKRWVDEVKMFHGRKWGGSEVPPEPRLWTCPKNERNLYVLRYLQGQRERHFAEYGGEKITLSIAGLFEHQIEGIQFIIQKRRCMLAFEMGLGKTRTVIEVRKLLPDSLALNAWLVAPKGALVEWQRQLKHWKGQPFLYTTTYESLHKVMDKAPWAPQFLVLDETIKIKNHQAQRSQITAELTRLMRATYGDTCFIIALSGAPAAKVPTDWWHQIECLQPGVIKQPDVWTFQREYADIEDQELWEDGVLVGKFPKVVEWKNLELLGKRLSCIVMSKRKEDCLDLPPKIYDVIDVSQPPYQTKDEYKKLLRSAKFIANQSGTAIGILETLRELSDGFKYQDKENVETLQQDRCLVDNLKAPNIHNVAGHSYTIINCPKLLAIRELLDFYQDVGRLVIYAHFKASIQMITKVVQEEGWEAITTITTESLERFQDDDSKLCIVINPAKVHGLNLQSTYCLVYYSNSFSTDARIQSEDRRDRPGMDINRGTRIVDIINLPTDKRIMEGLKSEIGLQQITLEEIQECLN